MESHPVSFDPIAPPLTPDIVQDYPAAWDWRLVAGFVVAGLLTLYLL